MFCCNLLLSFFNAVSVLTIIHLLILQEDIVMAGTLYEEDAELDEDEAANLECRLTEMSPEEREKLRDDIELCARNRMEIFRIQSAAEEEDNSDETASDETEAKRKKRETEEQLSMGNILYRFY